MSRSPDGTPPACKPFATVAVEPVGHTTGPAFVHRASGCSFEHVTVPSYPPSPRGQRLRDARVLGSGCSLREAAKRLGMKPVDYSAIEHGSAVFVDDADWAQAERIIRGERGPVTPCPCAACNAPK